MPIEHLPALLREGGGRETRAAEGSPAGPAEPEHCARRDACDRRSWFDQRIVAAHGTSRATHMRERRRSAPDRDRPSRATPRPQALIVGTRNTPHTLISGAEGRGTLRLAELER